MVGKEAASLPQSISDTMSDGLPYGAQEDPVYQ